LLNVYEMASTCPDEADKENVSNNTHLPLSSRSTSPSFVPFKIGMMTNATPPLHSSARQQQLSSSSSSAQGNEYSEVECQTGNSKLSTVPSPRKQAWLQVQQQWQRRKDRHEVTERRSAKQVQHTQARASTSTTTPPAVSGTTLGTGTREEVERHSGNSEAHPISSSKHCKFYASVPIPSSERW
jgi:hypothetical protein